ncbi:Sodium/hydrogen exchanger 2 isoform D [Glycine soja]|uniref:Sodium/hydrogen exchanger 2 isoform D n=1 Tax=Glycine soja TaxID=3848 RepID=A0A445GVU9_GLYSO|nr:Sodium/hydrogen exchanger 2 isoform D [Glycine soja]
MLPVPIRHSTDHEVALIVHMAYLSYILYELFSLGAILTVFFCDIVMSHCTWHNVIESSRVTTKHVFATLSFIVEIFIFLYVGMDALDIEKWQIVSQRKGWQLGSMLQQLLEMLMHNIEDLVHQLVIDTGIIHVLVKIVKKK